MHKNRFTIKELQKSRSRIKALSKKRQKLNEEIDEIYSTLEKWCHCPEKYRTAKSVYIPGTFLNDDYSTYWDECIFCGKRHTQTTKDHGYYG